MCNHFDALSCADGVLVELFGGESVKFVVTVFQNFYPFVVACWAVSETVFRIRVTIETHTPIVPCSVRVLYVLRTFILVVCCHLVGSFSACFRYTYIVS